MEENKNVLKAKVEAALFLTEKPLKATAVAKIVQEDVDKVRRTIIELINDYEERNLGLEIADDSGYIIQVKDQYATLIDEFVPLEIPTSLIRTLSAIAIKQPVMQSEIIKIRGAGAYEHIKELIERELINKKEDGGRSPTLTTTKKFQEYFRLSKDGNSLRQVLIRQDKEREEQEAKNAEAEETFDASPDSDNDGKEQGIEQQKLDFGPDLIENSGDTKNDDSIEPEEDTTTDTVPEITERTEDEESKSQDDEEPGDTDSPIEAMEAETSEVTTIKPDINISVDTSSVSESNNIVEA